MADFPTLIFDGVVFFCATLENRFLGTFLLFNCAKSLGTLPKHGDGVPDLTNDSEPAFRRLALLKAGSEGRPRNFPRFPPLPSSTTYGRLFCLVGDCMRW